MQDPHNEKREAQMEQMEAQFDELKAKIKEAGADGKIFLKEKLEQLQKMMDQNKNFPKKKNWSMTSVSLQGTIAYQNICTSIFFPPSQFFHYKPISNNEGQLCFMIKHFTKALTILIMGFIFLLTPQSANAANYYVSKDGDNDDGTSWATAWNELNQISWGSILPGDIIYLDGGSTSMTYTTILYPTASGISGNPITIQLSTESGRNGQVIIDGGRLAALPECGQATYAPYANAAAVTVLAQGVRWDGVSYVVLDGTKWEGISIHGSTYGMRFYNDSANITIKNIEIYDAGSVLQQDDGTSLGLWYSDSPGIRIEGSGHILERMHIHDNGQDGIQSGGSTPNNLDNITIRESWFHNEREHSGTDNSPGGDAADDLGAPAQGESYNGFNESFNWCRHSDAIQLYSGGQIENFVIEDSVFGPGHTNTLILGDVSGGGAYLTDSRISNSLIIKGADNNLNGKVGLSPHLNWDLDHLTIYSPNTKTNNIRLYGSGHNITDSVFHSMNAFFESSLATDTGNCVYNMTGHSFGSIFTDPMFESVTTDPFSLDDYTIPSDSDCYGKGSTITSSDDLLILVGAITPSPSPSPSPTPTPTPDPTVSPDPTSQPETSSSVSSGNSFTEAKPPFCSQEPPIGQSDLFQINTSCHLSTLFFTPLTNGNYYHFSYGRDINANEYGATFHYEHDNNGVVSYDINLLTKGETYYFRILPANQCAPGSYSNVMQITVPQYCNQSRYYYRYN